MMPRRHALPGAARVLRALTLAAAAALAGAILLGGRPGLASADPATTVPGAAQPAAPAPLAAGGGLRLAVANRAPAPSGTPPDPAPAPSPQPSAPAPAPSGQGGCGFFDLGCQVGHAINSWFTGLVQSAAGPLFGLLGRTLLATPQVGGFATVRDLWAGSLAIADASYLLLVLAGGIVVMSHQTLQTSYAVKDIAPRLVVGFLAANLSLLLAGKAIAFADGMSAALAGEGLDPAAAGAMLRSLTERIIGSAGTFFVLLALFAVALVLVLTIIFAARLMLTVVLIAIAPLALACHALPQTEGVARWWWRAFAGVLAIQAAQAVVLVAAARVFFTEQWTSLITGTATGPGNATAFDAIQLLCLLYILIRIPFWIGRRVWSGGRSPLRSAARFVFAAAVLRRITPVLSGRAGRSAAARAARSRTRRGRPGGGP